MAKVAQAILISFSRWKSFFKRAIGKYKLNKNSA